MLNLSNVYINSEITYVLIVIYLEDILEDSWYEQNVINDKKY